MLLFAISGLRMPRFLRKKPGLLDHRQPLSLTHVARSHQNFGHHYRRLWPSPDRGAGVGVSGTSISIKISRGSGLSPWPYELVVVDLDACGMHKLGLVDKRIHARPGRRARVGAENETGATKRTNGSPATEC